MCAFAIRQRISTIPFQAVGAYINTLALLSPQKAGALALHLFSKPRASKSRIHNNELLSEAQQYSIQVDGSQIRYYHWKGKGQRILLAHGWESNASRWAPLIRALRDQDFDIIAPDAPAHGYSDGPIFNVAIYARVLDALLATFPAHILVGHSAGGMASIFMLYQNSTTSIQKVVLLSAPSELLHLMDYFRRVIFMNDRAFKGMQVFFQAKYGWSMQAFSLQQFVQQISVAGLVIHDRQDSIAPYDEGLAIHQNWSGSTLITTDGLGHSLPGEAVVQHILHWLNTPR